MSSIWQRNLNKLIQFKEEFGHVNVPKSYSDMKLARLVTTIRQQKRYGTLPSERELALHRIGFDFEPMQSRWLSAYNKVVEFYRLNGHVSPNRRSANEYERALADWTHRMHKLIRNNQLDEEKVHKLSLINIDGKPGNHKLSLTGLPKSFEKKLKRLKKYISNNSTLIHSNMSDPVVYRWVLLQQQRINASLITPAEYSSLIKTGFELEQQDQQDSNQHSEKYIQLKINYS